MGQKAAEQFKDQLEVEIKYIASVKTKILHKISPKIKKTCQQDHFLKISDPSVRKYLVWMVSCRYTPGSSVGDMFL